jgi:hypothetical protein
MCEKADVLLWLLARVGDQPVKIRRTRAKDKDKDDIELPIEPARLKGPVHRGNTRLDTLMATATQRGSFILV